jgi:hypothetical protein
MYKPSIDLPSRYLFSYLSTYIWDPFLVDDDLLQVGYLLVLLFTPKRTSIWHYELENSVDQGSKGRLLGFEID